MANKFTDATFKARLDGSVKVVLYTLAWRSDNESGVCWTANRKLAQDSGVSVSTAKRSIKWLIENRIISITGQRPSRHGPINEYTISHQVLSDLDSSERTGVRVNPVQSEPTTQFRVSLNPVQSDPQNSSLNSATELIQPSGETPEPPGGESQIQKPNQEDITMTKRCKVHGSNPQPGCYSCGDSTPAVEVETSIQSSVVAAFPFNIHPWDDITQAELDRVIDYQWKVRKPAYWPSRIHTVFEFKRAWPTMLKQSEGHTIATPKKQSMVWIGQLTCPKCHGWGSYVGFDPENVRDIFQHEWECDCRYQVPLNSPEHKAAEEHFMEYRAPQSSEKPKEPFIPTFDTSDMDL